jgi:hypothetical protein
LRSGLGGALAVASPVFGAKASLTNRGPPSCCGGLDPYWVREGVKTTSAHSGSVRRPGGPMSNSAGPSAKSPARRRKIQQKAMELKA